MDLTGRFTKVVNNILNFKITNNKEKKYRKLEEKKVIWGALGPTYQLLIFFLIIIIRNQRNIQDWNRLSPLISSTLFYVCDVITSNV